MVKVLNSNYWTLSDIVRQSRASSLLVRLHVSSQLRSRFFPPVSMHSQTASAAPTEQLANGLMAATPQTGTVGITVYFSPPQNLLQCNFPSPEFGRGTKKKKTLDSIDIATKYCSSQLGINFCLRCIELDLARESLFYRNTMRNMQHQRQYIINLIVSWAFLRHSRSTIK